MNVQLETVLARETCGSLEAKDEAMVEEKLGEGVSYGAQRGAPGLRQCLAQGCESCVRVWPADPDHRYGADAGATRERENGVGHPYSPNRYATICGRLL
jgi:hypothetical protein